LDNWVKDILDAVEKKYKYVKAAVGWPPQDSSQEVLEELQRRGYQEVRWRAPNAQCFECNDLDGQVWPIADFLYFTKHNAPIFSKSHVGCRCVMVVSGVDKVTGEKLPEKGVDAYYYDFNL